MNETTESNHTTMTEMTETDRFTMLQHLYTSCRKTQLHLTAYNEATSPESIMADEVPDIDYYNYDQDLEATEEMLEASQRILDYLECHRIHLYPGSPAFEDATCDTTNDSPRSYHAAEAAAWISTAKTISQAYTVVVADTPPAAFEAHQMAIKIRNLLVAIDEHGEEHTLNGCVDIRALLAATANLKEMNPHYEEWAAEADEDDGDASFLD